MIDALLARGWVPDPLIRWQIRRLLRAREREILAGGVESVQARFMALLEQGAIGTVNHVRFEMDEDFMADPEALFYWKSEASSGYGALDDFERALRIADDVVRHKLLRLPDAEATRRGMPVGA